MLQKLRENRPLLAFLALFAMALWFVNIARTVQHESVHRHICRSFGGENVTTYTNYTFGFTSGETWCSNATSERNQGLYMENEIVGYHVDALICAFFLGVLLMVIYLELREEHVVPKTCFSPLWDSLRLQRPAARTCASPFSRDYKKREKLI